MNALRGLALLAAGIVLAVASPALTQDKASKVLFEKSGEITDKDSFDRLLKKSYSVGVPFKMKADETYRIDLSSKDFDTVLRIENEAGKNLMADSGGAQDGTANARIIFTAPQDGEYQLIATSRAPGETGKFQITVSTPTKADLLTAKVRQFSKLDGDEREKVLTDFLTHLEEQGKKITRGDANMAMNLSFAMESSKFRGIGDWSQKLSKSLEQSEVSDVRDMAKLLAGVARRVRLIGNKMEVTGTLLDGTKINWDSYRGKVVLVDYWATWCGPCIQELPNVLKLYDAYKDKGFDVVGISLDRGADELTRFVEKRKIPWVTIFEKDSKSQPMADHYGVMSIPLPILVDKEGRVISMTARGLELERLLEKELGPIDGEKK